MVAQQRLVDVIANNLANVNTPGFKRSRVNFEDVLYETVQASNVVNYAASQTTAPVQVGKGVRVSAIQRLQAQGGLEMTGRSLDLALDGDGFFQIQRPDGTTAYTRDGNFTLSDTGTLVTNNGHLLLPGITIPAEATSVQVSQSGIVSVAMDGEVNPAEIGKIELARFLNPSGLQSIGENQYIETTASGEATAGSPQERGFARIVQGALESSNVEIVQEMTDMIAAQRAYEINARAIQAGDDMMQMTNDIIR
jgi:flagellar basal-body rod protein FlgG